MTHYPRQLSAGANRSPKAKPQSFFVEDTRSEIGSEARKMRYVNGVNDLV